MRVLTVACAMILFVLSMVLSPSAEGTDFPKAIIGKDGAPLVLIPAGPFPMGVPKGDRDGGRDEYPNHEVMLDAYYMATLLGLPIGHISWAVDLKENRFNSVATGSIAGFLRLFLDAQGSVAGAWPLSVSVRCVPRRAIRDRW